MPPLKLSQSSGHIICFFSCLAPYKPRKLPRDQFGQTAKQAVTSSCRRAAAAAAVQYASTHEPQLLLKTSCLSIIAGR